MLVRFASQLASSVDTSAGLTPLRWANSSVSVCAEAAADAESKANRIGKTMRTVDVCADMACSRHQSNLPTPDEAPSGGVRSES